MNLNNHFEHPSSGCKVTYATICKAFDKEQDGQPFPMELVGKAEVQAVISAVNMGIDSHLEACYCPDKGDYYGDLQRSFEAKEDTDHWKQGDTVVYATGLACQVSKESLPTLLRRLAHGEFPDPNVNPDDCEGEDVFDDASSLVGGILHCLGINDSGEYVGYESC